MCKHAVQERSRYITDFVQYSSVLWLSSLVTNGNSALGPCLRGGTRNIENQQSKKGLEGISLRNPSKFKGNQGLGARSIRVACGRPILKVCSNRSQLGAASSGSHTDWRGVPRSRSAGATFGTRARALGWTSRHRHAALSPLQGRAVRLRT